MSLRCLLLAFCALGADPQFLKSTLYATQPLERPPQAIVNVYEPAARGHSSFMEQESDSRIERLTQAPVVRIKLQRGAAPSFLSAKRRGDEVTGLVADLAGSGQGAEQALARLHELLATPSTAAAVRSSSVMGSLRGLLASQTSSERVRQLAGSLVAHLTDMPVASEQMDGSTGSGGNVYITVPAHRHADLSASFLEQESGSAASGLQQYPFAEPSAGQAREPNQVNVVFDVPGRGGASFLQQQSQGRKSDDVPVVNVHIQTLSEPLEPFVKGVADLMTAAERSMGQM